MVFCDNRVKFTPDFSTSYTFLFEKITVTITHFGFVEA